MLGWRTFAGVAFSALLVSGAGTPQAQMPAKQNIAHRGASAYAPEHTIAAYTLALEQQADYVEQDLAVTRDGVLICLHDDSLNRTTNVEQMYPTRASSSTVSGRGNPGSQWLANDFTLAEIRKLDAGSWFDARFASSTIPTWDEAVSLVQGKAGLYPELKSPPLYTSRGVDMVKLFVDSVQKRGLAQPASLKSTPMIVQSFDEATIRRLAGELPTVPRVFLMGSFEKGGMTDARLRDIATFATGIGPTKELIEKDPGVVKRAHAAGLTVTAYTFRSRATGRFPNVRAEMAHFLNTFGIDALFTDNPDQFPR
jgi:glycerophosphoryl diester phosphodiesterase